MAILFQLECGGTRSRLFRLEGNVKTIVAAVMFPIVNEEDLEESKAGFRFMYFFLRVLEPSSVGRFFLF